MCFTSLFLKDTRWKEEKRGREKRDDTAGAPFVVPQNPSPLFTDIIIVPPNSLKLCEGCCASAPACTSKKRLFEVMAGFVSGRELNVNMETESQQKSIVEIYVDWANHYLERSGVRRHLGSLERDVRDGTLLALLIEAVLQCKVPAVNFSPATPQHMVSLYIVMLFVDKMLLVISLLGTI
ncbi:hypothetical protein BIW11_08654 [Tropilaelaps mercedesae]|uniref:Calponin-homology (CH) domain-containing protein n=1 Tax=Tropilaelaps mercedesae TaxID=418985 RepID=A0A1V9XNK5_9ACAR|nr:hypothetical protein BIW11_08654 [Tropilaelaps mercedesae]